uniref:Ig-like domain-containing protein n=1 Tax=Roseihalotalea indica TaxID=2867963 RepID=A0AA49PZW8_9BACT|nr:Ig-like domain-containing protein [Tunicatimonas sp. TK19036]
MKVSIMYMLGYTLILTVLLLSCEEDKLIGNNEVLDEELPTLSITSPAESDRVWLTTQLEAEATDNQGVARVIFYLNDEMLGEDTEAPYTLDLDTREYEDGMYELKVKAYDEAENEQETVQTIEILNKLVQVNVGENHLDNDWAPEEGWVVVTDIDGNTIDYEPLISGQSVTINRPEGVETEKINVVIIENVFFGEGNKVLIIDQYDNISPLTLNLPSRNVDKQIIGTAQVSYAIPADYESHLESFWDGSNTGDSFRYFRNRENITRRELNLEIIQEPAGLFVSIEDIDIGEAPQFVFLDDIKVNDNYTLDSEEFQKMELWQTITLPEGAYPRLSIYGNSKKSGNRYNIYSNIPSYDEDVFAYIHESAFTDFSFNLSFEKNNKRYSLFSGEKPQSHYSFPNQELKITEKAPNQFSAIVSSEKLITYSMVQYGNMYDVNDHQHILVWNIYTDLEDTLNVKQIILPAEIKNKYPELEEHQPEYAFTELATYEKMSSLQSYLNWFNNLEKENAEYEKTMFFSGYSNGRTQKPLYHRVPLTNGQLWEPGAQPSTSRLFP